MRRFSDSIQRITQSGRDGFQSVIPIISIILLVGTKLDLEDLIAVDDESALHLKNTFNMIDYVKTSSKTGFNVDKPFEMLVQQLVNSSKY